jgi:DNA-binding IclR family transcriptional regulator
MPQVTVYKCLRDLREKGLLEHVGGRGSGLYRLG